MASALNLKFDSVDSRLWRQRLLSWYDAHKRDLPWRRDRDPYRVWLSEIMLQQTRVSAVLDHYRLFLKRFPTVVALAAARQSTVLAAWSGLGYYRRARMMHAAAKVIVKQHAGKFPGTIAELRALPGVGRYTASAVASIVFDIPTAVVDGNVERVLGRVHGIPLAGETVWQAADGLLSRKRPGDFNQAMMELGATICLPRQPLCDRCPVFGLCASRGTLGASNKRIRQKRRKIGYGLDHRNGSVLLVQRPKRSSLMPGMWELPERPLAGKALPGTVTLRHSITVTDYTVLVTPGPIPFHIGGRWVAQARISRLPLTGLARKILRQTRII
jgi:A/G-specific adenine glycosylase